MRKPRPTARSTTRRGRRLDVAYHRRLRTLKEKAGARRRCREVAEVVYVDFCPLRDRRAGELPLQALQRLAMKRLGHRVDLCAITLPPSTWRAMESYYLGLLTIAAPAMVEGFRRWWWCCGPRADVRLRVGRVVFEFGGASAVWS